MVRLTSSSVVLLALSLGSVVRGWDLKDQEEQHRNADCDNGCFFGSFPGGSCTNDAACMCTQQKYREKYFCCMAEKCVSSVLPDSIVRQHRECQARNMDFTFDAEAVCGIKVVHSTSFATSAVPTSAAAASSTSAASTLVTSSTGGASTSAAASSTPVTSVSTGTTAVSVASSAASSAASSGPVATGNSTATGSKPTPTSGASGEKVHVVLGGLAVGAAVAGLLFC